jgi:DMSO reductase anchor subunit
MEFLQAYAPIIFAVFLVMAGIVFFAYFREQNGVVQVLLIVAAVYAALLIFEKNPNYHINRFLQGLFK